ncbi:hypothetical protein G647_08593 [Cladophialophora carrionii CBS 160.54]|uniref:Aminoglycoside phosphotransferase domain-containing protein n=1 Tax=Cladophialophora carrionii CBS 160.54 TaxID=1279043 RepID=V9D1P3_9EURO|nr:uncharacterized protein G647_08593 [Cladophialophora carrionii CBS 160.54]ETI20556.1 hypothetical protein G647_08593 [Cladophialophora carrionii CBS 160.54]
MLRQLADGISILDNGNINSYGSRVRIIHSTKNQGAWTIGTRWILRDQPNDRFLGNNYITLKFLHQQPDLDIPIPKEVRSLSQPTDPIYFTLESRVLGDSLRDTWAEASPEEKASYSRQLAEILRKLRRFTAPRPHKVDGSQLDDFIIATCLTSGPGTCFKIPYNVDEWLDGIGADLRMGLARDYDTADQAFIEQEFQELKDGFPTCSPFVLTHADLNLTNIIVKDGKIQGIIDWERAGYYPWWMERLAMERLGDDSIDELFKPIWEELMPEVSDRAWRRVANNLDCMRSTYSQFDHEHPGKNKTWHRPPFCKCTHDAVGIFKMMHWGGQVSCKITEPGSEEQKTLLEVYKRPDPWACEAPARGEDEPQPETK